MYTFFSIFGYLFICVSATFLNYIYDIFSINKLTNFLVPIDNKSIWNKINITVLPIIVWSLIELPVLCSNGNFILAIIANIVISCALIYEIKYSALVFFNKENNFVNLLAIYVATMLGQTMQFMILKMKPFFPSNSLISIIGLLVILGLYVLITTHPPRISFFKIIEKKD